MTEISITARQPATRARRRGLHALRRDVAVGLSVALLGLVMTMVGSRGDLLSQTWPGDEASQATLNVDQGVSLAPFPAGVLPAP
jgi:hypothetical protein